MGNGCHPHRPPHLDDDPQDHDYASNGRLDQARGFTAPCSTGLVRCRTLPDTPPPEGACRASVRPKTCECRAAGELLLRLLPRAEHSREVISVGDAIGIEV